MLTLAAKQHKQTTKTQQRKEEMQIPQPDARIVPRKKDHKTRTGPEPKAKHHKLPLAALMGHSAHQCRKTKQAIQPKSVRSKSSSVKVAVVQRR